MAFPLAPALGQLHTEAGIEYEWTGATWDVVLVSNQELTISTVDPTPADVAEVGVVWRNTTSGSAFQYEEVTPGVFEWVKIYKETTIQLNSNSVTQPGGSSLIPGDLEIDGGGLTPGVLRYYDGAQWLPIDTFFDNSIALLTGSPDTTQEALDVLASRVALLTKGLAYYGTYDANTDNADFTAASGLTDGALPAAGPTNQDTYLVVTVDGTPATGPLAGTFMDKGDWVVSDGVSWTHLDISTNVDEFIELIDTPAVYTGAAGKVVRVNATETALEFAAFEDTQGIYAATAPTLRVNGNPLQVGDRWIDSTTFRPYNWDGAAWQPVSPVIVSTTTPVQTTPGLMWYNPSISTMFVYDNVAAQWVGI